MSDDNHGGVPTLATLVEPRAYELAAHAQTLILGLHGHRCQTSRAELDGARLDRHGREQNVANHAAVEGRNQRNPIGAASQRLDELGLLRAAKGSFIDLSDGDAIAGVFEPDGDFHLPRNLATGPSTPFGNCSSANRSSSRRALFSLVSSLFSVAVNSSCPGSPYKL